MIIADPIELRNNVARNIRKKTLRELKEEMNRGIKCCKDKDFDKLVKLRVVRGRKWKTTIVDGDRPQTSIFFGKKNNRRGRRRKNRKGGWKRKRNEDW